MSANVETMMYVGETPWHGLGNRLIDVPDTRQAIIAAGLDWKVEMKPLFLGNGTQAPAKAIVRATDQSILGISGPRYTPLQNEEAFEFFDPFVQSGEVTLETAGSLAAGKRVWILAKLKRDDMEIVPGDSVQKYFLLSSPHDGKAAVRVGFTPIRVVCQNTLHAAHNDAESKLIKVRHTSQVVANLEYVRETVNLANAEFEATAEKYRFLASRDINQTDLEKYIKIVFYGPRAADDEKAGKRVVPNVVNLFENGRGNSMPGVRGTHWAAYNAVTEYLQYERGKNEEKRMDSLAFGQGAAFNKKALDVALIMAAA